MFHLQLSQNMHNYAFKSPHQKIIIQNISTTYKISTTIPHNTSPNKSQISCISVKQVSARGGASMYPRHAVEPPQPFNLHLLSSARGGASMYPRHAVEPPQPFNLHLLSWVFSILNPVKYNACTNSLSYVTGKLHLLEHRVQ